MLSASQINKRIRIQDGLHDLQYNVTASLEPLYTRLLINLPQPERFQRIDPKWPKWKIELDAGDNNMNTSNQRSHE